MLPSRPLAWLDARLRRTGATLPARRRTGSFRRGRSLRPLRLDVHADSDSLPAQRARLTSLEPRRDARPVEAVRAAENLQLTIVGLHIHAADAALLEPGAGSQLLVLSGPWRRAWLSLR